MTVKYRAAPGTKPGAAGGSSATLRKYQAASRTSDSSKAGVQTFSGNNLLIIDFHVNAARQISCCSYSREVRTMSLKNANCRHSFNPSRQMQLTVAL